MLAVQAQLGEPIEAWLRRKYYDEDKTLFGIAAEITIRTGVEYNPSTIWHWLRRCGIPSKTLQPPPSKEVCQ